MNDILRLTPSIYPFVKELVVNGRIGITSGSIRVEDIRSGHGTFTNEPLGDRFKIVIPYACLSLQWDVVFVGNNSDHPPDFVFDDKNFLPDVKDLKSLSKWNKEDHTVLLQLIEELLACYRQHQIDLIDKNSRVQFEYSSLIEQSDIDEEMIELHVRKTQNRSGPVNFLIRLPVDFSRIPLHLLDVKPDDISAFLLATFQSADSNKITPQLFMTPGIEEVLGGVRLPPLLADVCLMDYVPEVCQLIKTKVEQIATSFEKRKSFVQEFLCQFKGALIECENEGFTSVAFLFEWNEYYFVLDISLPPTFPQDPPNFRFQSVYYLMRDKPFQLSLTSFPYSPRWDCEEMIERFRCYIVEFLPTFKKRSIQQCS